MKYLLFLCLIISSAICSKLYAQIVTAEDTFFLLKKKGLLKKLGKSIYRETEPDNPIKSVNPFLAFKGKTIRSITIAPTGFNKPPNDSVNRFKKSAAKLADYFHRNTLPEVIRKNLFFKEGDKILPLLLSDNERFLRELSFIKDALIVVDSDSLSDYADVIIITKDVFSLGGSLKVSSKEKAQVTVRDENFFGTGATVEYTSLYDKNRNPFQGFGGSVTHKNIKHSFINWSTGIKTFNPAFNSGRQEENNFFTVLDKPLVSRYDAWTGAVVLAFSATKNSYVTDSAYVNEFKYKSLTTDIWAGYNIGHRNRKDRDSEKRLRHFVAIRSFYNKFYAVPELYKNNYNYSYADINGFLMSYSLYKQNFYRTNFIYGFGRNEDVPEGINGTIVTGYTNKEGVKRGYYGLEFDATHYSEKGFFTGYTLRLGTYINNRKSEDADILIGINRFTKLYRMNKKWTNRNFLSLNYTRQFKTILSAPLILQSGYGLPYFANSTDVGDTRSTLKFESVFYNMKKFLGFRFAPFIFSDVSFLKPVLREIGKTKGFTAVGGGVRTRNENLVFGTVELKGYFFPRVYDGMKGWKVELGTNIRFKYNSSFIRRPDFISPN